MKRIVSRDNPHFRTLRREVGHGGRESGAAILEGVHLCDAYLRSGGAPREVIVGERGAQHPDIVDLVRRAAGVPGHLLDDRLFATLSDVAHGVPILMVIDRPDPGPPAPPVRTSVLLDRVQDPGNVGSILRSACAAGIEDVYLSRECAQPWSTKVLRAAMGAHFRMRLFEDCDLDRLLGDGVLKVLATSPHAAASLHDTDLTGAVAWLFGHEGQGIAPPLLDRATSIRIPQATAVESLNVAAAAAICFFEQLRQRDSASR